MTANGLFQGRGWLVIGVALAGAWLAFKCVIAPMQERERDIRAEIASLREKIAAGRNTMMEIKNLEIKSTGAQKELQRLDDELPTSPPVVWIPEHIKQHFGRSGFAEVIIRQKTALAEPEFPGYQRISWSMDIPMKNVAQQIGSLLLAVSELEETERIVRVGDIAIQADAPQSGLRAASVTFSTLVRK